MALKDIQIPKVEVMVGPGSSFAVRGLSTTDIQFLVRKHGPQLRELFDEYVTGNKKDTAVKDIGKAIKDVVSRCPEIMLDVVSLGADADEDDLAVLKKLGLNVHINALTQIAVLTMSHDGDKGKALEAVISLIGKVNGGMDGMLAELTNQRNLSPSIDGSGESESK